MYVSFVSLFITVPSVQYWLELVGKKIISFAMMTLRAAGRHDDRLARCFTAGFTAGFTDVFGFLCKK